MPNGAKIATCCYCGTRAALVLGEGRHELICASCGAPLHDLKRLPAAAVDRHRDNPRLPVMKDARKVEPRRNFEHAPPPRPSGKKDKRGKKRKSLGRWLWSEALDVIEDIFD